MLKKINRIAIVFLDYFFIFLCVLPFAYAIGGVYGVVMVTFVSFICTIHGILEKSHSINFTLGTTSGFIIALILWGVFSIKIKYWEALDIAFSLSFCISFILGMIPQTLGIFFPKLNFLASKKVTYAVMIIGLITLLLSIISIVMKVQGTETLMFESAIIRGVIYGMCIGTLYSVFIRYFLLPSLSVFTILVHYVRAMILPVSAFFIGYFLLTFAFSGIYGVIGLFDPIAFTGSSIPWRFNEYIYYSIMTITTLGAADIYAHSLIAKWVTVIEVLLGVAWVTVVLAATIGYLQKTFAQLAEKYHK